MKLLSIFILLFCLSCMPKKQDIILQHHYTDVYGSGETEGYCHYVYAKYYHPTYHNKAYLIKLAQQYLDSVDIERRNDKPVGIIKFVNSIRYFEKTSDSHDNDWSYIHDNYDFFSVRTKGYKDFNEIDTTKGVRYYPNKYSWW